MNGDFFRMSFCLKQMGKSRADLVDLLASKNQNERRVLGGLVSPSGPTPRRDLAVAHLTGPAQPS